MGPNYQFWNKPWFIVNALTAIFAALTMVQLFRYRKIAIYYATAVFLLRLGGTLGLVPNTSQSVHEFWLARWLGVALNLGVLVYLWLQRRRGVLK